MTRSIAWLAIAGAMTLPARAGAVLCTTKHGAVVEREACRRKESAVDLAARSAAGAPGDAGTPGASTARLRAVDAGGRSIGYVSGFGLVLIPHEGRVVTVPADEGGFIADGKLYFAAAGCLGPGFVFGDGRISAVASVRGTSAFYAGDPIASYAYQSYQSGSDPPPTGCTGGDYDAATGQCCITGTGSVLAGPATSIDLGGFTPPFRLEIER